MTRQPRSRFNRPTTKFRNWITPDGSPGPSGEGGFAAETGRYHLYVTLACPWAHRTIIMRSLKDLQFYQVLLFSDKVRYPLGKPATWQRYDPPADLLERVTPRQRALLSGESRYAFRRGQF